MSLATHSAEQGPAPASESLPVTRTPLDGWPSCVAALIALSVPLLFLGAPGRGYVSMEAMVLEGGRNMLETGDWLVPRLYGEIYTYKPPLAYWVAAAPAAVTDGLPSASLLRLPFLLAALALSLVTLFVVGRRLTPRAGLLCGVASLGGVVFLEKVRLAEFDTLVAAPTGCAVLFASAALADERPPRAGGGPLWLAAYLALALGFLAKGVPALMGFLPGLVLAALLNRRLSRLFTPAHLASAATFVAFLGLYVALVVDVVGWDGFVQPTQEARTKGFGWSLGSIAFAVVKPLAICAAFAPFSVFVPRALGRLRTEPEGALDRLMRSGAGFLLGGVLAFTAVPSHEMRYYLPLAGSFGLVCGLGAELALRRGPSRFESRAVTVLTVLLVPVAVVGIVRRTEPISIALLITALSATAALAFHRRRPLAGNVPTVIAMTLFLAVAQALFFVPGRAVSRDLSPIAVELDGMVPEDATLWTAGPADTAGKHSSLYAPLARRILVFDPEDPLGSAPSEGWFLLTEPDWQLHAKRLGLDEVGAAGPPSRRFLVGTRRATTAPARPTSP